MKDEIDGGIDDALHRDAASTAAPPPLWHVGIYHGSGDHERNR